MKKIIIFTFLCLFSSFSFAKVEWFSGSVEEAFKEAAKKDKLVYLYWGAVWCPPCNLLKKRVFSTKDFQKTMENFIPVYLDGDEKRAQIWGEKFKIGGYPTTLVLDGSKQELLRLSTGSSVDEYTDHLKSTLKKRYSLKALTQKALLAKASREEWKALEGFSWYEEEKLNLLGENKVQGLKTLYLNSPRQFKEKFFLIYLDKLAKDKPELSKKEKEELAKKYDDSILIENTINAYMEDILFGAKDHLNFLFEKKALKQREEKLQDLLIKYRKKSKDADELLTTYALFAEMEEPLSKKDQKELADIVFKVEAETKDPYLYHSSMSTGLWLLKKSEQDEKAKELAQKILKKSHSPYYFMGSLGGIYEKEGNYPKAFEWYEKAWKSVPGENSALQWAGSYLRKHLKIYPKEKKKNLEIFDEILKKYAPQEDFLAGRNKGSMVRILKAFSQKSYEAEAFKLYRVECSKSHGKSDCEGLLGF